MPIGDFSSDDADSRLEAYSKASFALALVTNIIHRLCVAVNPWTARRPLPLNQVFLRIWIKEGPCASMLSRA